jgi:hypothetical protein
MDHTAFRHLRPNERLQEYRSRLFHFALQCPEEPVAYTALWKVLRYCRVYDGNWYRDTPFTYQTAIQHFRVQTKIRRFELQFMLDYLPGVDVYANPELEDELLAEGRELAGIFEVIIHACSPQVPAARIERN